MQRSAEKLERTAHRFALGVALLVALSIPLGFWMVAYRDIADALDFKAKVKAAALSTLIASNPDVWMYAENRLQGLISHEPVSLNDELVEVFDKDKTLVARAGNAFGPTLARAYPLHDVGVVVGEVVVSSSAHALIRDTLICALLSVILATLIYAAQIGKEPVRSEPIRADGDHRGAAGAEPATLAPSDAALLSSPRVTTEDALDTLPPYEASVLRMRFGVEMKFGHSREEVGKQFDVTRERIRRLDAKARRELRYPARSDKLRSALDNGSN